MSQGFTDGYYWLTGDKPEEEPFIAWVMKSPAWGWRLDRWHGTFNDFGKHLHILNPESGPIHPGAHIPAAAAHIEAAPEVVPAIMTRFGTGVAVLGSDGGLWALFPGDPEFTPLPDLPARRTP